jgi:hypothetical protein
MINHHKGAGQSSPGALEKRSTLKRDNPSNASSFPSSLPIHRSISSTR